MSQSLLCGKPLQFQPEQRALCGEGTWPCRTLPKGHAVSMKRRGAALWLASYSVCKKKTKAHSIPSFFFLTCSGVNKLKVEKEVTDDLLTTTALSVRAL